MTWDRGVPALTVWIYETALGAVAGAARLTSLRERESLEIHDAITVSWMPDARATANPTPVVRHGGADSGGSVLSELVGLELLAPSPEGTVGAGVAAFAERLQGTGIDRMFMEEMRAHLHPESSALLVLSGDVDLDQVRRVVERGLAPADVVLMHASLPADAPDVLWDAVRDLQDRGGDGGS